MHSRKIHPNIKWKSNSAPFFDGINWPRTEFYIRPPCYSLAFVFVATTLISEIYTIPVYMLFLSFEQNNVHSIFLFSFF